MKTENSKRILLFIYTSFSTFVSQDYDILAEENLVDKYQFELSKKPVIFVWQFIRQLIHLILFGWKYDLFFIWFADYHSLLPIIFAKLTGKKSILVIGGYDAGRLKALEYGAYTKKWRGFFTIQSIKNCTINLSVSQYIQRKLNYIAPNALRKLVYNCVSFNTPLTDHAKENIILTVASIQSERTFYLKGIDTFFEIAQQLPQVQFQLIGLNKSKLGHLLVNVPSNIQIQDALPHEQLIDYYQKAKVYCQFSRMESFCLTLAEAMYFNCFPVVVNVGGMPEVTGGFGELVPRSSIRIAEIIQQILDKPEQHHFREYIIHKFSVKTRKYELIQTITNLYTK